MQQSWYELRAGLNSIRIICGNHGTKSGEGGGFAGRAFYRGAQPYQKLCILADFERLTVLTGATVLYRSRLLVPARVRNNTWSSWYGIGACLNYIRITCGDPGTKWCAFIPVLHNAVHEISLASHHVAPRPALFQPQGETKARPGPSGVSFRKTAVARTPLDPCARGMCAPIG